MSENAGDVYEMLFRELPPCTPRFREEPSTI
jgi:hypothetical protein